MTHVTGGEILTPDWMSYTFWKCTVNWILRFICTVLDSLLVLVRIVSV